MGDLIQFPSGGLGMNVEIIGAREMAREMEAAAKRLLNLSPVMTTFGVYMKGSIRENFDAHGRPDSWKQSTRFGESASDPLDDEGKLKKSVDYSIGPEDLWMGAGGVSGMPPKAKLLQFGGIITPKKGKYLVIPQVGPGRLSRQQVRDGVRPRDIQEGFPLIHGPEGPGIYVPNGASRGSTRGLGRGDAPILRVFAFVLKITVPPRPFVEYQDEDLLVFGDLLVHYAFGFDDWRQYARAA